MRVILDLPNTAPLKVLTELARSLGGRLRFIRPGHYVINDPHETHPRPDNVVRLPRARP